MEWGVQQEGEVTQTAQTVPAHFALSFMNKYKGLTERFFTEPKPLRLRALELAIQSLRETFELKEKELEYPIKDLHNQQVDGLRLTIKSNVDVIRLQKQLSNERTAHLVIKDNYTVLKEAYEAQLEEAQRSLQENQGTLLGKVGQLIEQLKQEKQKTLLLEGELYTATISLHSIAELQERVSDIEGERNLLKKGYNALLLSTLNHNEHESEKESEREEVKDCRAGMSALEKKLEDQKREREKVEQEKERVVQDYERSQMERAQERAMTTSLKENHDLLKQEVQQYRQRVTSLQEKLNRVSKAFRLHHESCESLMGLVNNEKDKDSSQELAALQASHAETILELQKTRELLVMQHRLNSDLQADMKAEKEKAEREREWKRCEVTEKDKLLKNRDLQINSLKAQLKDLTYCRRNYNQNIPQQYPRTVVDQELVRMTNGKTILNQLQDGSLLELNLVGATFTPVGLRLLRQQTGVNTSGPHELVTFCTYTLLDFEMQSTPLVSGTQPKYGFTFCHVLTHQRFTELVGQGVCAHVEVHQALGGVQFKTHGSARIPLIQTLRHKEEKVNGRVNITGSKGEIIGVLEFCIRLFSEVNPKNIRTDRITDEMMTSMTEQLPADRATYWSHTQLEPKPSSLHARLQQPQFIATESPPKELGAKWTQFPIYNQTCHTRSSSQKLNKSSSKQMRSRHNLKKAMEEENKKKKGEEESQPIRLQDQLDSKVLKSMESITTSDSDVIIPKPQRLIKEGYSLKVEILSLLLDPSSSVALDQSVQQVYVEYRLLGIPMETTETPMSLQKPKEGEEIHFNFSRVIHVDSMEAAPLRQYLYTILESTDPKYGRLKFTVVSEPLNDEEECVDVGYAHLELQELLLTGNDATECQIDIIRLDGDQEVVGRLRVSLEAPKALTGIPSDYSN
ncbi:X-linked retinitis pigmentosa GTPase regulator-interacting protein 1 [Clarias gariepinus]|uniref:X-linked retinitis pigmentosa GTPase regulator-interacting protein 1 n=1 Tax=Clarias gariepinus TaxID=13013 RepID=UPI00234C521B|nr:X-linked retinitis pigmentosa GTPase regulator-interacting protein 1 [Clarias gariepinus]